MGRLHDELGGPGPWEDLFVPRNAAGDGAPDGAATWTDYAAAISKPVAARQAPVLTDYALQHPEAVDLLQRLRFTNPARLRRMSRDLKWMRKQAIKRNIDPEEIRWIL